MTFLSIVRRRAERIPGDSSRRLYKQVFRSRHSVRHAFRPAVERLLDFRKEELLGGWIRLGERRPIEIAKVCETMSLIHSALSSRGTNELSI